MSNLTSGFISQCWSVSSQACSGVKLKKLTFNRICNSRHTAIALYRSDRLSLCFHSNSLGEKGLVVWANSWHSHNRCNSTGQHRRVMKITLTVLKFKKITPNPQTTWTSPKLQLRFYHRQRYDIKKFLKIFENKSWTCLNLDNKVSMMKNIGIK